MQWNLECDSESKESFLFILFLKVVHSTDNSVWEKKKGKRKEKAFSNQTHLHPLCHTKRKR